MEYYNTYDSGYIRAINNQHNTYKIKLELLSYFESVIGNITKDVSTTAQGQLNINYQPLTRRSVSLSMINVDEKYIPSANNPFWFERKFKLWIGVVDRLTGNTYWWAQGVFYTQSANSDGKTVNIEAVDKGGALDGTLGMNQAGVQHKIEVGSTIDELIRTTLMLNLHDDENAYEYTIYRGGDKPVDPVIPIIDLKYRNIKTQSEISVDANNSIGEIFTQLANGYGADVYYDINGHLQFAELTDGTRVDGYKYMAHQWEYNCDNAFYGLGNFQYNFEGKNCVTVFTNSSLFENVSYTAFNYNPTSPLRVGLVGTRRMEDVEMPYTDVNPNDVLERAKRYANYLLIVEAMKGMNVTFDSPLIPHLDVNRTIGITDKTQKFNNDTFIIQSISMPLSAGSMSITATNLGWLPNVYGVEGIGNG